MPGLDAYRRHGGVHQDQYRTAKQARDDAEVDIDERLADMCDRDCGWQPGCGAGPFWADEPAPQSA